MIYRTVEASYSVLMHILQRIPLVQVFLRTRTDVFPFSIKNIVSTFPNCVEAVGQNNSGCPMRLFDWFNCGTFGYLTSDRDIAKR
jgi:hypothetical protein